MRSFCHYSKAITGIAFKNDHLVSSSQDGYLFVWDLQSKQVLRKDKFKGAWLLYCMFHIMT